MTIIKGLQCRKQHTSKSIGSHTSALTNSQMMVTPNNSTTASFTKVLSVWM